MAAAQKKARRVGASLVCLDESGFQLTPVVRRTLAPRGHTPVRPCWDRRDRLSAISAVTLSPRQRRPGFYFTVLSDDRNVRGPDVVIFLRQLRRHVRRPLRVVWDRAQVHDRAAVVRAYLATQPAIETVPLPAYAPELNPDERVWGHVKYGRLANYAPADTASLRRTVVTELSGLRHRPDLLVAFIHHADDPTYEARLFHSQGGSH